MSYRAWIDPEALSEAQATPGHIIYVVDDTACWVWVLAVRKRPPYDYGDLAELLRRIK